MKENNIIINIIRRYLKRVFPFLISKNNILFEMNGVVLVKSQEKHFYFHRTLCDEVRAFCKSFNNIDIDKVIFMSSFDADLFKSEEDVTISNILTKHDSRIVVKKDDDKVIACVFIGDYLIIK